MSTIRTDPNLTEETINQNLRQMTWPWPSPVVSRGNEIEKELKMGIKFPFKDVLHAHSGDPQGNGQKPMTFFQQVTALCINPALLQTDNFPHDVKHKATTILKNCNGQTIGSYSDNRGMTVVRKQVANFIQQRDNVPASYEDVFLSSGATDALRIVLYLFNTNDELKPPGVMVPIPEYPLFSSTVGEYGMYQISYYLDEDNQWAISIDELKRAVNEARNNCDPKVLVIINPGNPSGFVMSRNDIQNIIKFAYEENLFILADEVYQYNVYDPKYQFFSFKKIMSEMGEPYKKMELASFMSGSKGYMGECGARSGYCEIINLDNQVKKLLKKLLSTAILCPPLLGQIIMYCITNPPKQNEPSYELFEKEKNSILNSLKERAQLCYEKFNVKGLSCNKVFGAMYVYPRIDLSRKAIKMAKVRGLTPDEFYTMELLERTGVCVIPGCLFGQKSNTYHFRMTFLPQMEKLKVIIEKILMFHEQFMKEYEDYAE